MEACDMLLKSRELKIYSHDFFESVVFSKLLRTRVRTNVHSNQNSKLKLASLMTPRCLPKRMITAAPLTHQVIKTIICGLIFINIRS